MKKDENLNADIIFINTRDIGGGTEKVAADLRKSLEQLDIYSDYWVGYKRDTHSDTREIPCLRSAKMWQKFSWKIHGKLQPFESHSKLICRIRGYLRTLAEGLPGIIRACGYENFNYPGTQRLIENLASQPSIFHLHNLHGGYFDLRLLSKMSTLRPVVITMHDEWMYTGHCAHSLDCSRWMTGCGSCPDLNRYPEIGKDKTRDNWMRKRNIYARSRVNLIAPSQWLADRVALSILQNQQLRVIPNGVDLDLFTPSLEREAIRRNLGIGEDEIVLLYSAVGGSQNVYKDHTTVRRAVSKIIGNGKKDQKICFLELGGEENLTSTENNFQFRQVAYTSDIQKVAQIFQCADFYLHAAKADNFPTVILESLASGVPVVATSVGGIPEQIIDGQTGYLVGPGDWEMMAEKIQLLLNQPEIRQEMMVSARKDAVKRFDVKIQARKYLEVYQQLAPTLTRKDGCQF